MKALVAACEEKWLRCWVGRTLRDVSKTMESSEENPKPLKFRKWEPVSSEVYCDRLKLELWDTGLSEEFLQSCREKYQNVEICHDKI